MYKRQQIVVGGAVPKNYFPAVEKGIQESVTKGPLAGYPVVGVKAVLYDEMCIRDSNMGVKSLNRYLNQYKAADEKTKNITKKLIRLEEKLTAEVQKFL